MAVAFRMQKEQMQKEQMQKTDIEIADMEKEEHHGLQTGIRHTGYRTELAAAA